MNLFEEARNFSIYILKITKNKNVFTEEFQTAITDRLNANAVDLYLNLWKANNTKLSADTYSIRKEYQRKALCNIIDFLSVWDLAIRAFHLKSKRTEYVTGRLVAIEEVIKKWSKSDVERLKKS